MFAAVEGAMESGQRAWRDRESGQAGLFGEVLEAEGHHEQPLPKVPDWTEKDKLAGEKELLGFWVTGHPLDRYTEKIADVATHNTGNLEGLAKGVEVALCGVLSGVTRKRNKEGKPWAAMTIEDRDGSVEAMVFATSYERLAPQVVEDQAVLIRGLILPEENAQPKLSVQDIIALDNVRIDMPSVIAIRVWLGRNGVNDKAQALNEVFRKKPGDTQVRLRLESPRDFSLLLDVSAKVRPDREFKAAVEAICGSECVEKVAT
jgi:DNA polymerase-3 subunit alpha